ncbi:unnamed protein product [Somion occarium]|uniref:Uncharacterized protein n=1 Tax=Somion occarium TaxID=3059160 RepID=A0ABP1E2E3_9APHY
MLVKQWLHEFVKEMVSSPRIRELRFSGTERTRRTTICKIALFFPFFVSLVDHIMLILDVVSSQDIHDVNQLKGPTRTLPHSDGNSDHTPRKLERTR